MCTRVGEQGQAMQKNENVASQMGAGLTGARNIQNIWGQLVHKYLFGGSWSLGSLGGHRFRKNSLHRGRARYGEVCGM